MFKKNEIKKLNEILKNKYLIGLNLTNDYLEVRIYDKDTNTIDVDFFNIKDEKVISSLHDRRRKDTFEMFNPIYNDIYINQVEDLNKAVMSFDKIDNKYQINYDVSTNLIRKNEEVIFISDFIDLYRKGRRVYKIDKNIIDINEYKNRDTLIPKGCNITLLDNRNYIKELHILGKLLCKEFIPTFEEMKELEIIERKI